MSLRGFGISAIAAAALAGCVTVPTGPSVMVLPGDGRSFDQFRADDADCRNFAYSQTGSAEQAQADSVAKSAILGTLLGAAAGAAIGGNSRGTGTGAAIGLTMGAVAGTGAAQGSAYSMQRRYDVSFQQCMYAKGHRIGGAARASYPYPPPLGYAPAAAPYYPAPAAAPYYPAPAAAPYYPPPPPGSAPPPR